MAAFEMGAFMAKDHRIAKGTERLSYTCENTGYRTNVSKGVRHGVYSRNRGSIRKEPLVDRNGYTLWLEHVTEKKNGDDWYWLMWYHDGIPTIPLSSIFDESDLRNMARLLPAPTL
jgi:hypothetical protein